MKLCILDTDHISLFQREHPVVTKRVNQANPKQIATTIITVEEQIRGRLAQIKKSSSDTIVLDYAKLDATLNFFKSINVLDFTQDANSCYQDLVRQKIRIGTQDLRIAAIALSVDGIVVTRNHKDFVKIPNLRIEDWTIR
ncbi:MAG: type II toxin-antitoxin system VapC family toxin [Tolypothrix sp. Co-bin9]|nr:type II toxin-antitoxin system VapC family toxin [Tolypothrix sp. Co-bin9]